MFCFIDRANIGNARLAGLEADLGMAGYDCECNAPSFLSSTMLTSDGDNILLSAFYAPYVAFEIPCMLLVKICEYSPR